MNGGGKEEMERRAESSFTKLSMLRTKKPHTIYKTASTTFSITLQAPPSGPNVMAML